MDKFTAISSLQELYKLENRPSDTITMNLQEYTQLHLSIILDAGQGTWDNEIAREYLTKLRQAINL